MNLVDSSAWLEYFADGPNSEFFAAAIETPAELLVSTINLYEVFKKVLLERDLDSALKTVAVMQQGRVIDVSSELAFSGARVSSELALPMADSLILATARAFEAILWTQDSDFDGLEGVRYRAKRTR